jgi:hypothetical protein
VAELNPLPPQNAGIFLFCGAIYSASPQQKNKHFVETEYAKIYQKLRNQAKARKSDTLLFLNAKEAAAELEARFTRKDGMNRRCFRKSNVSL